MAKAGNFAAYKQLTPIQEDFGDDALRTAEYHRRRKADERAEQAQIEAKNNKLIQSLALSNSKLKPFDTKHKGLNTYIYKAVEEAKEQLPDLYKKLNNPNASMDERIEAQSAIYSLENLPASLKAMTQGVTDHIATQTKGIEDGTLLASQEYIDFMRNGFDMSNPDGVQGDIILDKNYNPLLLYKNNKGEAKAVSMTDFLNGDLPSNRRKFDLMGMVAEHQKMIGTENEVDEKGFRTSDVKRINQASLDFMERITEQLFNIDEDGKMSDAMYSVWVGDLGRNPEDITQKDVEEMRDEYKKYVFAGVDTHDKSTFDYSGWNASENRKQKNQTNAITPEISYDAETNSPEVRDMNGSYGTVITLGNDGIEMPSEGNKTRKLRNLIRLDDGSYRADIEVAQTFNEYEKDNNGNTVISKRTVNDVLENEEISTTELNNAIYNKSIVNEKGDRIKNAVEFDKFIDSKIGDVNKVSKAQQLGLE